MEAAGDCGPMVVHCSAGVGRAGSFVVVDVELEKYLNESTIDIFTGSLAFYHVPMSAYGFCCSCDDSTAVPMQARANMAAVCICAPSADRRHCQSGLRLRFTTEIIESNGPQCRKTRHERMCCSDSTCRTRSQRKVVLR